MSGRPHLMNRRSAQHGFSLVELMVALTVGLILLGMASAIFMLTSQTTRVSTLQAQMNEDATLALEVLGHHIRLAGHSGFRPAEDERNFQGQALFGCDGGFANSHNTANTGDFQELTCETDTSGPDALAVRYEATNLNSHTVTGAGGTVLPVNCVHEGIAPWWQQSAAQTAISLAENRFYVAPDPADDEMLGLRCRGRNGQGFSNVATLVPHIEDMQILYALTALPRAGEPLPHQVTAYRNASQVDVWSRVAGARICVVAYSSERIAGLPPEMQSYVDCSGNRVDGPGDQRIRRSYVVTLMGRNLRPGLPAPFANQQSPWRTGDGGD